MGLELAPKLNLVQWAAADSVHTDLTFVALLGACIFR